MLYLFDANVLITASNTYYPIDQVPEYWAWLYHQSRSGNIKLPHEIMQEILAGKKKDDDDPLLLWLEDAVIKKALLLDEKIDPDIVNTVVEVGYGNDLTDDELEEIGRDPFLIAYGIVGGGERCAVTVEVSKPSKKRQNRKVPDVCETFGIPCCNPFRVNRDLGFKTGWKA